MCNSTKQKFKKPKLTKDMENYSQNGNYYGITQVERSQWNMLSKRSQSKKITYSMISFTYDLIYIKYSDNVLSFSYIGQLH